MDVNIAIEMTCSDGSLSSEMIAFAVLSLLVAIGTYNCIAYWRFPPFRTAEGNLTFNVWLVGSLTMSFWEYLLVRFSVVKQAGLTWGYSC